MGGGMKIILASMLVVAVLIVSLLILSGLLSEPTRGRQLVQALGIPRPAVIAHRGPSYLAPEETRPAVLMAR